MPVCLMECEQTDVTMEWDNLISNERSYLHVVSALRDPALSGGAYVGVGPDPSFSYIAHLRPSIAFILDVRRDNLLLHLLFKALFALAPTRIEYLSLLIGSPGPGDTTAWRAADVVRIIEHVEQAGSLQEEAIRSLRARVDATIAGFGPALPAQDMATIDRFHRTFIAGRLAMRFSVKHGDMRVPELYRPSLRELLLETDSEGRRASFLADEDGYGRVRALQGRDLVVLAVGNLSGPSALADIGRMIATRGEHLSAFYTSNVEFYLCADGTFPRFVENLSRLPRTSASVILRTAFPEPGITPPLRPGYGSASITQRIDALLEGVSQGRFQRYQELATAS
jgi:hypothetical protein